MIEKRFKIVFIASDDTMQIDVASLSSIIDMKKAQTARPNIKSSHGSTCTCCGKPTADLVNVKVTFYCF